MDRAHNTIKNDLPHFKANNNVEQPISFKQIGQIEYEQYAEQLHELTKSVYEQKKVWRKEDFAIDIQSKQSVYFVAQKAEVIGYLGIQFIMDEATITNIAVKKDWQGTGVAKVLFEQAIKFFKLENIINCFLEVRSKNYSAQKFYEKMGFKQIAIRKNYYHEPLDDAIIYQWTDQQL